MIRPLAVSLRAGALGLMVCLSTFSSVDAGPFGRRAAGTRYLPTRQVVTTRPSDLAPSPMLGSFVANPMMMVGGAGVAGENGWTPLQQYGSGTLSMYGPLSSLRSTAAPVVTYQRGYDGVMRTSVGTGFSYPNLPPAGSVMYPTRTNYSYGFRYQQSPPWWDGAGANWVDFD